jgi:hypothetical protein
MILEQSTSAVRWISEGKESELSVRFNAAVSHA